MKAIDVFEETQAVSRARAVFENALTLRDTYRAQNPGEGPLLFLSQRAVRENIRALAAALPGVGLYYAMKSNDHPAILEIVAAEGHGFDVCSVEEIRKCTSAGASENALLHTHPVKTDYEIREALGRGVNLFVIDNADEIAKFAAYRGQARLLIRFRAVTTEELGGAVQCDLSFKFGCAPREIIDLAKTIIATGLEYAGLAFHVGSQCQNSDPYLKAINIASDQIIALEVAGINTTILDIGGGFPVEYLEEAPSIESFCRPIRQALTSLIAPEVRIICEPGRFISAPAVTLVATVIGKSVRHGMQWYYLDDGVYGSFSGRLYDHCSYKILTNRNTVWTPSVLAGPTCDSIDIVYQSVLLPPLEIGDPLVFPAMGAYCAVSASDFNSLVKAITVVVD